MFLFFFRCKRSGYVNGMVGTLKMYENTTIYLQTDSKLVPVFPEHQPKTGKLYYPICPFHTTTVHKIQGQTLSHVTIVFDKEYIAPGIGYVAISRVRSLKDVVPLLRVTKNHFRPITNKK